MEMTLDITIWTLLSEKLQHARLHARLHAFCRDYGINPIPPFALCKSTEYIPLNYSLWNLSKNELSFYENKCSQRITLEVSGQLALKMKRFKFSVLS